MINLVKGTHDVILDEAKKYEAVESVFRDLASLYGFKEFRTPILEHSELFQRSVGDSSDIVRKEMYTFLDKGERSLTLRPELTAGIMRSIVNNKLLALDEGPVKAFYLGPCFRYERPQAGRYRQFNQFGIEMVGINDIYRDVEVITFGYHALKVMGFENLTLKINTLGDKETREKYNSALKEYFSKHIDSMCGDCKERFNLNVLRILDCKIKEDQEIVKNAPKIQDYLSDYAKDRFERILESLKDLNIEYEVDQNLVRGLDYYSDVVFEFHYTSKKGVNYGAIGAGGHYSNLFRELGGNKDLEGCGVAFGIERIVSVLEDDGSLEKIKNSVNVYIMPSSDVTRSFASLLAKELRTNGASTDICYENKSMKSMLKKADKLSAIVGIILNDDLLKENKAIVKNLVTTEQEEVSTEDLLDRVFDVLVSEIKKKEDEDHEHDEDCDCEECHHHHEE